MDNFDVMCLKYENSINNLNSEFDIMMLEYTQNINNIETQCILESVDNDSLTSLYTEEVEKVKAKSKSIIRRMIDSIKEFLKKIKKAIFGDKTTGNASSDVTVEDDPKEIEKENKKWTDAVKKFISGNKKPLLILTGAVAATGVAVGTGVAIKKSKDKKNNKNVVIPQKKTGEAMKTCEDIVEDTEKCVEMIDSKTEEVAKTSSPEELAALKTGVNELQKNANKAANTSKKIRKKFSTTITKNASGTDITGSGVSDLFSTYIKNSVRDTYGKSLSYINMEVMSRKDASDFLSILNKTYKNEEDTRKQIIDNIKKENGPFKRALYSNPGYYNLKEDRPATNDEIEKYLAKKKK